MNRLAKISCLTVFGVLVIALLIGTRLNASFAGGTGYQTPEVLFVDAFRGTIIVDKAGQRENLNSGTTIPRGSVIETGSSSRVMLYTMPVLIWLSENTKVEVRKLDRTSIDLHLEKGRMIVSGDSATDRPISVSTNGIDATIGAQATMSVVNYDFKQLISVIPLIGNVTIATKNGVEITSTPFDLSDVAPYTMQANTFSPIGNAAEDFYQWYADSIDMTGKTGSTNQNSADTQE